jgi:hypothetical protein
MDFTKKPGGFLYIYIPGKPKTQHFLVIMGKNGIVAFQVYIYILPIAKLIYRPVFVGIHRIGWTAGASPGSLSPTKHVCFVNSPIKNAKRLYVVINRVFNCATESFQVGISSTTASKSGTLWELNSLLCKNYQFMAGSINQ